MRHFCGIAFFCFISTVLFAQKNISLLGQMTYNENLSDVWGYAANGREYALVGVRNGVSIVDVTAPPALPELFFVPGALSLWRDIAVWNGFAYVTNETGGGLQIIDLNFLPDSIRTYSWNGGTLGLTKAHTIFADDSGFAYIAGASNTAGRGVIMLDLRSNPANPTVAGKYNSYYVHDVYVRNDTLWTAEINNGQFEVIDISDKANPVVLAANSTPGNFTHNVWLSRDGKNLLTTDEINNAYIASYDVSDLGNIMLLDLFQSSPGFNVAPHNVHYAGDFAVASYYKDGVVIIDATDPKNLIQAGNYDTSPLSGSGFSGCWSVYPYLPSEKILASDIEEGLFVLAPVYQKACYLKGVISEMGTSQLLSDVSVKILPSNPAEFSDLAGAYHTGIIDSGTYSIEFSKSGFQTHVEQNVILKNDSTTTLNVQLIPAVRMALSGSLVDITDGGEIAGGDILIKNSVNNYNATTDSNGNFSIQNFETGSYEVFAGKWGFLTKKQNVIVLPGTSVLVGLQRGFYDDFIFDFGWKISSTAASGNWERDTPDGTNFNGAVANPDADVQNDFAEKCFVTGNDGGQAGNDDVDDGAVFLFSPAFDLSTMIDPHISYYRWFYNDGGTGNPDDSLLVFLSNSSDTILVDIVSATTSGWEKNLVRVIDFVTPDDSMHLIFKTADAAATGHLVEAGVDLFSAFDSNTFQIPVADFSVDKFSGCPGTSFTFTDLSVNQAATFFWEFPGGNPLSSTDQNPTVVYENPGNYSVTLYATNVRGSGTITKNNLITIYSLPQIHPIITHASAATTADGKISISTTPAFAFILWSSGDSMITELTNLSAGNYSVTVEDINGCVSSDTITVSVKIPSTVATHIEQKIKFFPNPFYNEIFISSEISKKLEVKIFNSVGEKVEEIIFDDSFNFQWGKHQQPGVYFIAVYEENKLIQMKKLLKVIN